MSIASRTTVAKLSHAECGWSGFAECDWTWRAGSGESWWDCDYRCPVCDKAVRDSVDEEQVPW